MSTPRPNKKSTPLASTRDAFLAKLVTEDIAGWDIRSKPTRLITPSGVKYPLSFLGAGTFATAYEVGDTGVVVAEVHDIGGKPLDFSKTVLAELLSEQQDAPHLPRIVYLGTTGVSELFGMHKYKVPIDQWQDPVAWAQHLRLRHCSDRAQSGIDHKFTTKGHIARDQTIACAARSRLIPKSLIKDLTLLSDHADRFGKSVLFEFPPRNLGTDEHGNLILLDVLFDYKVLKQADKAEKALKAAKAKGVRKNISPLAAWFDTLVASAVTPG